MHDALIVGVPVAVILAGILLNRQDVLNLRTDMNSRFDTVERNFNLRFDSIQRDMREFYAEQARHDVRIGKLEPAKERFVTATELLGEPRWHTATR